MNRNDPFQPDPRLAADSAFIAYGPLSQVRLMDDARFPWLLLAEINQLSQLLRTEAGVEKINIGALGNIVRQLHVHVVGRHAGDPAWPGPVWGSGAALRHDPEELAALTVRWRSRLG